MMGLIEAVQGRRPLPFRLEKSDPSVRKAMGIAERKQYEGRTLLPYKNIVELVGREKSFRPAGMAELSWLMDKSNWNTPEAEKFKDGKYHHFLGCPLEKAPNVIWQGGRFIAGIWKDTWWNPWENRAVLIPL